MKMNFCHKYTLATDAFGNTQKKKPQSLVPQAAFCSISFKIRCYIVLGAPISTVVIMIAPWTFLIAARRGNSVGGT